MEPLIPTIKKLLDLLYVIICFWAIGQGIEWFMQFS